MREIRSLVPHELAVRDRAPVGADDSLAVLEFDDSGAGQSGKIRRREDLPTTPEHDPVFITRQIVIGEHGVCLPR